MFQIAVDELVKRWHIAKQSKEAQTRFKKNQDFVRSIYDSALFQYLSGSFIIAVCCVQ